MMASLRQAATTPKSEGDDGQSSDDEGYDAPPPVPPKILNPPGDSSAARPSFSSGTGGPSRPSVSETELSSLKKKSSGWRPDDYRVGVLSRVVRPGKRSGWTASLFLCCFHPAAHLQEAEQMLRDYGFHEGLFLVRDKGDHGLSYALSIVYKQK